MVLQNANPHLTECGIRKDWLENLHLLINILYDVIYAILIWDHLIIYVISIYIYIFVYSHTTCIHNFISYRFTDNFVCSICMYVYIQVKIQRAKRETKEQVKMREEKKKEAEKKNNFPSSKDNVMMKKVSFAVRITL